MGLLNIYLSTARLNTDKSHYSLTPANFTLFTPLDFFFRIFSLQKGNISPLIPTMLEWESYVFHETLRMHKLTLDDVPRLQRFRGLFYSSYVFGCWLTLVPTWSHDTTVYHNLIFNLMNSHKMDVVATGVVMPIISFTPSKKFDTWNGSPNL